MAAPAKVNYIRHLSAFYHQVRQDDRLKVNHIGLYLALFQLWNQQQFRQPFPVPRDEVMRLCRIGSTNTYTRCLRDLHAFGYILYQPGGKQYPLSLIRIVYLVAPAASPDRFKQLSLFQEGEDDTCINFDTGTPASCRKNDTGPVAKMRQTLSQNCDTYINNINSNKTEGEKPHPPIKKNEKETGGVAATVFAPAAPPAPDLSIVKAFFSEHAYPAGEAMKFYHHYQANGWKQAGKTPISDWQAAAHKWVLNIHPKNQSEHVHRNTEQRQSAGRLHANTDKSYSDPL